MCELIGRPPSLVAKQHDPQLDQRVVDAEPRKQLTNTTVKDFLTPTPTLHV